MKNILLTAALLFSCSLAFTQTRLNGVAVDDRGEALIMATVKLMKGNVLVKGMITDFDGNFQFQTVEPGTYDVEFSYTGYETYRVDKVVVKENEETKIKVIMKSGAFCHYDLICPLYYYPPIIDQNPGNTGIILTSSRLYRKD